MNTALNYQPEVLVDTADLSREEWLDYRRLGIGGSDAAAITHFNAEKFKTRFACEAMQRQSWAYPHLRQSGICISIKLVLRQ